MNVKHIEVELLDAPALHELGEARDRRDVRADDAHVHGDALVALAEVREMQYMAQQIESMTRAMTDAVQQGQVQFQDTATQRFSELAAAVETSLKTSLAESARLVGDSIQPLVEATVATVAQQSQQAQQNLQDQTQACLQTATDRFADTAVTVGQAWQSGLQAASDSLVAHWQENSKQLQALQRQALEDLNARADRVTHAAEHSSTRLLQEWTQVLDRTSDLVDARLQTETQWLEQQNGRMEQLVETVRQELSALRGDVHRRSRRRGATLSSTPSAPTPRSRSRLSSSRVRRGWVRPRALKRSQSSSLGRGNVSGR